jgi:hypothetical protein
MGPTITTAVRYVSAADTAKLVRKALKARFPDTKFSVRTDVYAGGASVRVGWTDGPTDSEVQEVTQAYAGAGFDGMIDLKVYAQHWLHPDGTVTLAHREGTTGSFVEIIGDPIGPKAELVSFGADYIPTQRRISPEWREAILVMLEERSGQSIPRDSGEWSTQLPLHVTREGEVLRMVDSEVTYVNDLVHRYTATHSRSAT